MPSGPVYRTIREQIVEQLRKEVLSGALPEGQALREQPLAERFGVSRGPIRDALLQLTQEGLLVSQPNRGVRVGKAPSAGLQPLIVEFRRRLERHALEQIFDELTPGDLAELAKPLQEFKTACKRQDMAAVVEHDMAFHRWIVERARDADLLAVWLTIILRMRLRYTRHRTLLESFREHQAVWNAMRDKDRALALQALEANIQ